MSDLYNRIEELCEKNGVNVTEMCREAGVSRGNLTDLKMGRQAGLSAKNADKIASYLGVSVSYLLGTEQKEKLALTEEDEHDIKVKIDEIINMMAQQKGLMFDGDPLTPEAIESIRSAMELGMTAAKMKNKEENHKKE